MKTLSMKRKWTYGDAERETKETNVNREREKERDKRTHRWRAKTDFEREKIENVLI